MTFLIVYIVIFWIQNIIPLNIIAKRTCITRGFCHYGMNINGTIQAKTLKYQSGPCCVWNQSFQKKKQFYAHNTFLCYP